MTTEKKSSAGSLPWKARLLLSLSDVAESFTRRSDGTINRRLFGSLESSFKVGPKSSKGVKVSDITIDSTRNLWFRLFLPSDIPDNTKIPLIIYFHGGGFVYYSPDLKEFDQFCRRLAREAQVIVVSVNYRLSPEHKYPAQYEDGLDTIKFIEKKTTDDIARYADLSRCFVAGDSAGGNIAHHVACRFVKEERQSYELKLIGLIGIQPFFGGEERTESEIRFKKTPGLSVEKSDRYWKAFLPQGEDRDFKAVNVFGPNSTDISDLTMFPPTLVFVGGFDPLQDWQKRYVEGLKASGKKVRLIEYPDTIHGFYAFPDLPSASLLMAEVADFVRSNGKIKD